MTEEIRKDVRTVCNYSDAILNQGINQGISQGISQGIKIGEAKGDQQRLERDAKGMYAEGLRPDVIARIQDVSVDVIEKILGL